MNLSLRKKIITLTISLLVFVTVAASIITTLEIQRYFKNKIFEDLKSEIAQVEFLLSNTTLGSDIAVNYVLLASYTETTNLRLTLIDTSGQVIFDSKVPQDSLHHIENHIKRPEIIMALKKEYGYDDRTSSTINNPMFYVAKKYSNPHPQNEFLKHIAFIRLSIPLRDVNTVLREVRIKIFAGGGLALVIIALLSYYVSSRLTYPIHRLAKVAEKIKSGNLDARFEHPAKDELGGLADLLNQMLNKLKDDLVQLQKLEKVRTQFLGNVSHELRTPIFAVQGYLESLLDAKNFDSKTQKKFIKKAYRQAVRLNNLLTDLIDISRIESGEMKLTFRPFDVCDWLEDLLEDLNNTAQDANVTLTYNLHNTKGVKIIGDKERLNQVVTNIVENAIKYNKRGGNVTLSTTRKDKYIEFVVSDTGRGIAQEHLPRIFERFYRVDKERSRAVGGTGLGLAIVKHIIEAHNSKIKVDSTVGEGSTFRFTLPVKD